MFTDELPEDILYILFDHVDDQDSLPSSAKSRHPLANLTYVCKRWKEIVDRLIYVDLRVITQSGLDHLEQHLKHNPRARASVYRTTRRLWIGYALWPELTEPNSPSISDRLTEIFPLFGALRSIDVRFVLPSRGLKVLLDACGSRTKELKLFVSACSLDEESATALASLTSLHRLDLTFVKRKDDENQLPSVLSELAVPAKEVGMRFHFWWPGCDTLLRSLKFADLRKLSFGSFISDYEVDIGAALADLLTRHAGTIADFKFELRQFGPQHTFPPYSVMTNLEQLLIAHPKDARLPTDLPTSLIKLGVPILQRHASNSADISYNDHDLWTIFRKVVDGHFPKLQQLSTTINVSPLDWSAIDDDPVDDIPETFKKFAVAMQERGIQLLDIRGRTYSPQL